MVLPPLTRSTSDTFTAAGNGTILGLDYACKYYSIQVTGTGATPTAWSVVLEGSLEGTNFTTILTHTDTTGNGKVLFSGTTVYPSLYFRSRVVSLTLGSATNIIVKILGVA